jgi:cell filamentation protein
MMDQPTIIEGQGAGARALVTAAERLRREESVAFARANVRLEGFTPSVQAEAHAQRYVNGEIALVPPSTWSVTDVGQDRPPSIVDREQLEGDCAFWRLIELQMQPVVGCFDAQHLKEINRRIFQDLPGLAFADVTPGQYRPAVPAGKDWMKNRGLSTVEGSFYVAYSRMDAAAQDRLDLALQRADPIQLRGMDTAEFTASLAWLYVELDYAHPFSDGNSRTLRTFTRQLAKESGYELDWNRFAASKVGRDLLYIARDRGVNALAKPLARDERTITKLIYTMDRVAGNRDLPDLLRDAVRPSGAR